MQEKYPGKLEALRAKFRKTTGRTVAERTTLESPKTQKIDRRTLRRTGRTELLSVRVTAELKAEVHALAAADNLLVAEVIEQALAALQASKR